MPPSSAIGSLSSRYPHARQLTGSVRLDRTQAAKPGCDRNGGGASIRRSCFRLNSGGGSALGASSRLARRRQPAPSRLAARNDTASSGSPAKLTESPRPTGTAPAGNANRSEERRVGKESR